LYSLALLEAGLPPGVVQQAFAVAAERWARDGTPDNPGAWLTTTARRALDRSRRDRTLGGHWPFKPVAALHG
jgi:predicted RNA polymerase sigma factor